MPTLLVIRLHPVEPISGDDFTAYLNGLSIAAHQLSFSDPEGTGAAFGKADYLSTTFPPSPSPNPAPIPDPNTGITQHFIVTPVAGSNPPVATRGFFAVATAVMEVPDAPAGGEYQTADVRLVITRNGNELVHKELYYNVPVAPGALPAP